MFRTAPGDEVVAGLAQGPTAPLRPALDEIARNVVKSDRFRIATAAARNRGAAQDGGIGILTLAALLFSAGRESWAASRQDAFLEHGTITYKDLAHSPFWLETKEAVPRVIIVDDPGETVILRRTGSDVSVSRVANTPAQMAALQEFYHQTEQLGPQHHSNGPPGSSGNPPGDQVPLNFELAPLPINNVLPGGIDTPDVPTFSTPLFVPLILPQPAPAPQPAPTITAIPTIAITNPGNPGIVNASLANGGFPISGSTSGVENGQIVTITIIDGSNRVVYNGTTSVTDGTWSLALAWTDARALGDGSYTVMANVSDATGSAAPQATLTMTIDTVAAAPTLALVTDSGNSATDHITNSGALTTSGIEAGAIIEYSSDGGSSWSSSFTPVAGANSVQVRQTDVAGNVSGATTLSFTLDSANPAAPGVVLTTDSGSSGTDHITNSGALTTSGIEAGAIIAYSSDGGSIWSSSFTAAEGANILLVRQTDVAGNVSGAATFNFTLDTANPAAPGVALTTDSGSSGTDRITNSGALTTSGIEAGAIVAYSSDGGSTWSSSFTASEGANTVLVRQTDVAGNVSGAATLSFTLDTVNPAAPGVALMSDSGSSGTDHITSSGALTLAGIEAGAIVEYSSDGGSTWSSSFTASEGANIVQVRQTDVAGNVSAATFSFTLDTASPTVAVSIVDASLNDGDHSSQVTFTFSEAPVDFTAADVAAADGTLTGLAATANPLVYTATFTASDNFDGTGSVSVATGSYTDAAGNAGVGGSDSAAIDRDDVPAAQPDSSSGAEASSSGRSVNIAIVFDRSGSMSDDPGVNGYSERIDLARAAVANLLTGLDGAATQVNVLVVDFSSSAANSGWVSIDGANAYLAGLVASGGTNYDAALAMTQAAFVTATPDADQNIALFLSDGVPTSGQEIGAADQAAWESFLATHDMPSFAIGIGTGVTTAPLQPIAFDPDPGTQAADTPVVYGTGGEGALIDALSPLVIGSFLGSFSGNLLLNDQFGSDGAGAPKIDAVSYASVSGSSLVFTVTGATAPAPDTTRLIGSNDGVDYWQLDVNTTTGDYDLTLLQNFPHSAPGGTATIMFDYTIKDFDGDPSSSTLAVTIADVTTGTIASLPQIVGDNNANTLNGTGVAEILGGDAGDDTLYGNGGHDVLFGGAGNDTLNGGLGNDTLYGGSGTDTLDGGPGSDTMSGGTGSGNDTFVFSSVADSMSVAADTITDFVDSNDRIDVSAIDANTSTEAMDNFILVANATPAINPGVQANSITWYRDTANGETIVQADVNGDTTADLVIVLTGLHSLNSSFIL